MLSSDPSPRAYVTRARLMVVMAASWALAIGLVGPGSLPAAAIGAPLTIDDFSGTVHGTRTVTGFTAPAGGTTAPGTFSESGGRGTLAMNGYGNARGGVRLDYAFPSTDLGSGSPNAQFVLELGSVNRSPLPLGEDAVSVSISVTDATGVTGTSSAAFGNIANASLVTNFRCAAGNPCFTPAVDVSQVTGVRIDLLYPRHTDPNGSTRVVVDTIRTKPTGGALPPAPRPQIIAPGGNPSYGDVGTILEYTVDFVSSDAPVSVDGFTPSDVTMGGTAAGRNTVAVGGGPASYAVRVGPLTSAGTVTMQIPASVAVDAWGQDNHASNLSSLDFVIPSPPEITSSPPPPAVVDTPYAHRFTAGGVPAATYAVTAGTLPAGLFLEASGVLSGAPAAAGAFGFTVTASNRAGTDSQDVVLVVDMVPALTGPATANFVLGVAGSFTVTTTGRPSATLQLEGALPSGLTLVDNADGSATIMGTPTEAGTFPVTVIARNAVGEDSRALTVAVNQGAMVTSPAVATFRVGTRGRFEIVAGGLPPAEISVEGSLPDGLALTDHGDGSATLAGTPTAGGVSAVVVNAANVVGTATQPLQILVERAPVFNGDDSVTFQVGQPASFTTSVDGYPIAAIQTTSPLPAGLALTDNGNGTATIAGTPTAPGGVVQLALTATNGVGATGQALRLAVEEEPALTSAPTATFVLGVPATFDVSASGYPDPVITASTLPNGLTLDDNGDGTATISGTPTGSGGLFPVVLNATNSVATAVQVLQLAINEAPRLTSSKTATFTVGTPGAVTVTTSGYPDPVITGDGDLPAGLSLVDNGDGTATVSGIPAPPGGSTQLTLRATNMSGSTLQSLTVTLLQAPALESLTTASFVVGVVGTHLVSTNGFPAPTISASTLPAGLSLIDNSDGTATISGSPTGPAGRSVSTVTATNSVAVVTGQQPIVITTAPVFLTDQLAVFAIGEPGSFEIITDGDPDATISTADPLPPGLTLADHGDGTATLSGTLSGTPGPADETAVTLSAVNSGGTTEQVLTIQVQ